MSLVCAYGTLKRGFPNHHLLPECEFLGTCRTSRAYPLVAGGRWYTPILIAEPGSGHQVVGELYEVNDAGMIALDALEGVGLPLGFDRIEIGVDLGGETRSVWTYVKPRDRIDIIHSEPMTEYLPDPRYVPGEERGQPNSGFGSR